MLLIGDGPLKKKMEIDYKDLCSKHAEFQGLIDFNAKDNKICDSLSLGLRLLHNTKLIELMMHDKKNIAETINFTLLADIGNIKINQTATKKEIAESLDFFRES